MNKLFQQIRDDLDIFLTAVALLVKNVDAGLAMFPQDRLSIDKDLKHRMR